MSYLKDREIWLSNVPTGNPPAGYFWKFIQNGKVVVRDSSGNNQIMVATSGSQAITGSLTVTEGITGTVSSASYVEYSNVANKPALVSGSEQITYSGLTGIPSGIVSGSSQVTYSGLTGIPSGIVSGSSQVTYSGLSGIPSGIVSGSAQVAALGFATTGSNGFNGSQSITGSLTTTGTIVAQTLNVQQVTSSIVYSSGSNVFGNSLSNTQQFTGSVGVTGSLTVNGTNSLFNASNTLSSDILTVKGGGASGSFGFKIEANNGEDIFYTNNFTYDVITNPVNGKFGIGTTDPQSIFHIGRSAPSNAGVKPYTGLSSTHEGFLFDYYYNTSASNVRVFDIAALGFAINGAGGSELRFLTVPQTTTNTPLERMRITAAGNILIGGTVVQNNASNRGNLTINGTTSILNLSISDTNAGYLYHSGTDLLLVNAKNGATLFYTNDTERMRITSGGLVSMTVDDSGTNTLVDVLTLTHTTSGTATNGLGAGILFQSERPSGGITLKRAAIYGVAGTDANDDGDMVFYTLTDTGPSGFTEKMRITSGGQVGIKIAPNSGWGTAMAALQIGTGGVIDNWTGSDSSMSVGVNYYDNGSGSQLRLYAKGVSKIGFDQNVITFSNAASSSAGSAITFEERMRITSTGKVIINDTSTDGFFGINTKSSTGYNPNSYNGNDANIRLTNGSAGTSRYTGIAFGGGGATEGFFGVVQNSSNLAEFVWQTYNGSAYGERMRMTSGGNVGIGKTPTKRLDVEASVAGEVAQITNARNSSNGDYALVTLLGANATNTNNYHYIAGTSGGADRLYIYGNGNVVNINGSYGTLSDISLKENIVDATPKLADLLQLKVRNFNLIGSEEKQIGFVAQEFEEIFPKMVDIDGKNGMKTIKTSVLVPMLVKALQEQQTLIESLKSRIEILEQ